MRAPFLVVPFEDICSLDFRSLKSAILYRTQYPRPLHAIEPRTIIGWYLIFIHAFIKRARNQVDGGRIVFPKTTDGTNGTRPRFRPSNGHVNLTMWTSTTQAQRKGPARSGGV